MDISKLRFLLFQVRRPDDPMRGQEVRCFSRWLRCEPRQIEVLDLIHESPTPERLGRADVVLMGGSGDYSVAQGGPWLEGAMDAMRQLSDAGQPTFASCWGFQAMARALGGEVVTDLARAEVGTIELGLTEAGGRDPVMRPLGPTFLAQAGHQDIVTRLPAGATLLASSERCANQAFTLPGKPIYCTQFHPELDRRSLLERVDQYPEYAERILGITPEQFAAVCRETPSTNELLARFVHYVFVGEPDSA